MASKLALASFAATALAATAFSARAADIPAYSAAPAVFSWAGPYLGLNAGAGWTHESYATVPGGTLVSIPFDGSLGWGQNLPGTSRMGFTGGGQTGWNTQFNNIVFGIESDFQYYGAHATNDSSFTSTTPPGVGTLTNHVDSTTPWFSTSRLRLGTTLLNPRLLIYGTAGFAFGQENISASVNVHSGGALVETFPYSLKGEKMGYTIGGGAEWALNNRWSIKAEYLYVSLPANPSRTVATTFLGPAALPTDIVTLSSSRDNLNIVRVGLNYHFIGL